MHTAEIDDPVDDEPCTHEHVERDDDGIDRFFVCSDCNNVVIPDGEDGWEVVA